MPTRVPFTRFHAGVFDVVVPSRNVSPHDVKPQP